MATDDKWYFTKEQLANSPSRRCGIDADKELSYRQQAANFIQDMGQKLLVSQLCINTAIVYMHRFYVFHSLSQYHRNSIAVAAIFLAAKVEEQPRKLEHVIKVAHMCLHRDAPNFDLKSEQYQAEAQDLVFNESILLQTLGFKVAIDHPHTHVVKCCQLVKASKDLAQTSYFMASNSLHLTTMCLQYKPTVVACFCIHLACKWSNWEIPQSKEGKYWFWYVDNTVTSELLTRLTGEFLHIFDKCPSRLKKKIMQQQSQQSPHLNHLTSSPFDVEPRKIHDGTADGSFGFTRSETDNSKKLSSSSGRQHVDYHREKRERDKANSAAAHAPDPNKHHHKQSSSSANMPNKHLPPTASGMKPSSHHNHHSSARPDIKSLSQFPPVQHRHPASNYNSSSNSQSRDRQRIAHGHPMNNSLDSSVHNFAQEPLTVHPTEKLSNNMHKSHNDLRHKQQQQQQQQQKDVKPHPKSTDPARTARKPDNMEQRSEEMRKIMEKPAPPPKPRAEVIQEERASMMLKQSHYPSAKYGHQPEKPPPSVNPALAMSESKMLNIGRTALTNDKSPNAPVSASQIPPHKPLTNPAKATNQMPLVKNNGTSSSLGLMNNMVDKRQNSPVPPIPAAPLAKHRSLFSPEKTLASAKESSHSNQRMKQKPKSSAALPKDQDLSFTNSNSQPVTTDSMLNKQRLSNNMPSNLSQKNRNAHNLETNFDQLQHHQQNVDHRRFIPNVGSQEIQGFGGSSLPDLSQATRDNSINNKGMITNSTNELKSTGINKPLNSFDQMTMANNQQQKQQHHSLSNGFDTNTKREYSTIDTSIFDIKPDINLPDEILSTDMPTDFDFLKSESQVDDFLSFTDTIVKSEQRNEFDLKVKPENFSPMKSAQGISALLQEPLAPMTSLLQNIPGYEQQQRPSNKQDHTSMQSYNEVSAGPSFPSTVDMSALAPSNCNEITLPVTTAASVTAPIVLTSNDLSAASDEKKSEHRSKSEKKKKKEKHKNKDKEKEKDKTKEKHKNKHKDKDRSKEKHRDKSNREKDKTEESGGSSGYASSGVSVPIKITIAKDKLNLSSETAALPSSLKIKLPIPKDRFKSNEVSSHPAVPTQTPLVTPQAPLKLKIRTDALARGAGADLQQDHSRKRERSDFIDGSPVEAPPAKKHQQSQLQQFQQLQLQQQQQHQQQQQRPNERQNGRHNLYNPGSNNKVRGGGRGAGPRLPPYQYQQYALGQPNYRGYHHQQQHQSPPQFLRHPRPPIPPRPPLHHPHNPYFPNYPSAAMQNPVFSVGYPGNVFDSMYYQYHQQPQFPMYPTGNMSQIDTSVPPPSLQGLAPQVLGQNSEKENANFVGDADVSQPPPPPLPSGPPPDSTPPPPPPPE